MSSNKPKIFIRFIHGTGGHFLATVLLAMCTPIRLTNPRSGHHHWPFMTAGNDVADFIRLHPEYIDDGDRDILEDAKFLKENLTFKDDSPYPFFVIPTHHINPTVFTLAFENVKIINIKHNSSDIDQYVYNCILKTNSHYDRWLSKNLSDFKRMYPRKLSGIELKDIKRDNFRLIAYILKFVSLNYYERFRNQSLAHLDNIYDNVSWDDFVNKNLIDKLDELADFIGITLEPERKQNAIDVIIKYANAQESIKCPWSLNFDDFT